MNGHFGHLHIEHWGPERPGRLVRLWRRIVRRYWRTRRWLQGW